MPESIERKIKARGGAIRYRMVKRKGQLVHIVVVRQKGPRGGKTVGYKTAATPSSKQLTDAP